ncbi:fibrinogen silencer-binding protein [Protopterus annectens]|uniref:fibrinogen silencer-binding protein n=1 Tax=Protopterus annectens TaxID=7888 RepID=UPI001CFA33C4|nr:fibrinogen silencer-binding protein [Protopterus annectens]XP_043922485.1 fibrinogen silencer-binding protein [Protopterus annectens]
MVGKIAGKSRSSNFTVSEKLDLLELVEPYVNILDEHTNKHSIVIEKNKCWEIIAEKYNARRGQRPRRSALGLRTLYKRLKEYAKLELLHYKSCISESTRKAIEVIPRISRIFQGSEQKEFQCDSESDVSSGNDNSSGAFLLKNFAGPNMGLKQVAYCMTSDPTDAEIITETDSFRTPETKSGSKKENVSSSSPEPRRSSRQSYKSDRHVPGVEQSAQTQKHVVEAEEQEITEECELSPVSVLPQECHRMWNRMKPSYRVENEDDLNAPFHSASPELLICPSAVKLEFRSEADAKPSLSVPINPQHEVLEQGENTEPVSVTEECISPSLSPSPSFVNMDMGIVPSASPASQELLLQSQNVVSLRTAFGHDPGVLQMLKEEHEMNLENQRNLALYIQEKREGLKRKQQLEEELLKIKIRVEHYRAIQLTHGLPEFSSF